MTARKPRPSTVIPHRTGGVLPPSSYHDPIQGPARLIEYQRRAEYDRTTGPSLTLVQLEYLTGAIHKLLRVLNNRVSKRKMADDIIDSYNYCARLFGTVSDDDSQERT